MITETLSWLPESKSRIVVLGNTVINEAVNFPCGGQVQSSAPGAERYKDVPFQSCVLKELTLRKLLKMVDTRR